MGALALFSVGVPGLADIASAKELSIVHATPPGIVSRSYEEFVRTLEANSDLTTRTFGIELFDTKQTGTALRDGSVDVAHISTTYYAAEFSEMNLVADMTLLANIGGDPKSIGAVIGGAVTEYVMLRCPDCIDQFARYNQLYLGTGTGTQWRLLCNKPVKSAADIAGKRFRASVGVFRRWVESFGGTGNAINPAEMHEALGQNVIDCTVNAIPEITNFSLYDVVKYINNSVPGGTYGGTALTNVNLDSWAELTPEQRKAMFTAAGRANAYVTTSFYKDQDRDIERARSEGIIVDEADPQLIEDTAAFIEADLPMIKQTYQDLYKLENVDEKVETFRELLAKWKNLTDQIDPTSLDDLAELYEREIYSKIDAANYPPS